MNDEQYELLKKNVKKWNEYYRINGRHEANLTDANLRGSDLAGADLRRALLTGANLSKADLTDANLSKAFLTRARFVDADLTRSDLRGALVTGADFSGANLTRARIGQLDNAKYTVNTIWPTGFDPSAAGAILVTEKGARAKRIVTVINKIKVESAGFELRFDKRVTPEQVKVTLAALADYFRNCGGVGFVIDSDLQMLITEPRHAGVH